MKNKKKMAIICSTDYESYPMGGMMSFILDTLPYLKDDFDITLWGVVTEGNTGTSIKVHDDLYSFKTFSSVKTRNKIVPNLIRVSYNIWKIRKKILSDNYDVLYIHGIPLSFPFFNSKVKVVNHIHGLTNPFSMTANKMARNPISIKLYEKYRDYVVYKSDLILLASDKQGHQQFSERYTHEKGKIQYVPNFADNSIFNIQNKVESRKSLGLSLDEIILVNTGRISLQKDPILLLRALIYLVKNINITAKLVIIGDGELRNTIEDIVKKEHLESSVIITGKIDRKTINIWLNAADLYVYTSFANGFPISLAESAMCALPIVTTDVTGVHDLVIDNYSGFLVKERNPERIAEKVFSALENKQKFSQNIHKISKDFSPEIITDKIKKLLLSVIQ